MWRGMILAGFAVAALAAAGGFGFYLTATPRVMVEGPPVYTNSVTGLAINGYDPVAYFTEGQPVEGREDFSAEWGGAPWHFATAENRDMFLADPEHYAPQYGGWCAFAMAQDAYATTVPEAWTIKDDKLYLNFSPGVRSDWVSHAEELVPLANDFWARKS